LKKKNDLLRKAGFSISQGSQVDEGEGRDEEDEEGEDLVEASGR
jgi:hypothetical protein